LRPRELETLVGAEETVRSRQGILSKELRWPGEKIVSAQSAEAQEELIGLLFPQVIGAKTAKRKAIRLLRIAAEVEHSLLVQYLYAAFLLGPEADKKYREYLLTIAQQEMGHLVTVQNLLCLLGDSPHMDRDDLLPESDEEPAPFILEPITPESLAKYVVIEAPLEDEIKKIPEYAIYKKAKETIDPKLLPYLKRVGALYAAIYWLFMTSDKPEGPWTLDPRVVLVGPSRKLQGVHLAEDDFRPQQAISALIADRNEWNVNVGTIYVEQTFNRPAAQCAIYHIASQGEGIIDDPMNMSHFRSFLELFADAKKHPPDTINVSTEKSKFIATEAGRSVAEYFNTRYHILLVLIDLALRVPRSADRVRLKLSDLAIQQMSSGIGDLASWMLGLTAGPTNGPVPPTFELPDIVWLEESFSSIADARERLRDLLTKSREINKSIQTKWPGLMERQLANDLDRLDAQVENEIGKLPS
jgi:rubrerythrin